MPRSAADATRFTATGPHAYFKPGAVTRASTRWPIAASKRTQPSQASQPSQQPGNGGPETPRQKVERLRAEARAARFANTYSFTDRMILAGRVWADRLHLIFAYTILAFSAVGGVVIVYSFFSLVNHNRRQKLLWIDRELQKLYDARKAYVAGTATEEQLELLRQEKAGDEAAAKREEMRKQSYYYKTKQFLFGGLKNEDDANAASKNESDETSNSKPNVLEAVNAKIAEDPSVFQTKSADQSASGAEPAGSESKRSWTSWITGR